MEKLPTFSSNLFTWKNGNGTSNVETIGVPNFPKDGFYIRSTKTGKDQLFLPDSEKMANNEFYDGEASAYFAPTWYGITILIWA